jgi:3'(2'), 5'-bisphosphate nucleotidase
LSWLDWRGPQAAGRQWAFDPIDGTRGLLRGGQYVTALALIADGEVDLGAMACPRYDGFGSGGAFAVAVRRCGAWARGAGGGTWRRLAMASELDGKPRMIRSVESGWKTSRRLARLGKDLGIEPKELRMDSQVKYLALAAGEGDLVVRLPRRKGTVRENVWDHAAGVLLVEEAGGVVSDVHGTPLDFGAGTTLSRNLGVLASIAGLHERAVRAVGRVLD